MLNYIIFIGAVGLIIVAVIPFFFNGVFGANVSFGGTSIIIVVGVVLETCETDRVPVTCPQLQRLPEQLKMKVVVRKRHSLDLVQRNLFVTVTWHCFPVGSTKGTDLYAS